MKLKQYIKQLHIKKRVISAGVVASMLLTLPAFCMQGSEPFSSMLVYASSAKDKRDEAQNKLNEAQGQVDKLTGLQNEIDSQLSSKAQELAALMTNQQLLQQDMDDTQAQIDQATIDLQAAQEKEKQQYADMKTRIQFMYENGTEESLWTAILNAKGFADMLNRIEYVNKVYDSDRDMLDSYQETVQQVSDLKDQLELQMNDMVAMKESYDEQQVQLDQVMADLKAQSADYESQIASAKSLADQYAQTVAEQNAIIKEQERKAKEEQARKEREEKERKEKEAAAAAAAAASQDNNSSSSDTGSSYNANNMSGDNNPSTSVSGSAIVSYANQFVGNPYVWGGDSLTNGCDCSGFVHQVYANFGISTPRYSQSFASWGQAVSYNNMQAGDVVVYPGHVAIYMGNGCIVEAQSTSAGITNYRSVNCHSITAIRRAP